MTLNTTLLIIGKVPRLTLQGPPMNILIPLSFSHFPGYLCPLASLRKEAQAVFSIIFYLTSSLCTPHTLSALFHHVAGPAQLTFWTKPMGSLIP